jgi:uncharacterized protein YbgA (DUF1722 family)/uncharacterized protein YbbK (DUF523 family)
MNSITSEKIPVAIGACLGGEPVRFNGGSKHWPDVLDTLASVFSWQTFCPEMAIGLGVPREPIRLIGELGEERAVAISDHSRDVTDALRNKAAEYLAAHPGLCGYVLVKGSPSCGYQRVKRYRESGHLEKADASGAFVRGLQAVNPLLPLEEDGRLNDAALRESFVLRVFAYADWLVLQSAPLSVHRLIGFYSRYKYLVMSRDMNAYRQLGHLLANTEKKSAVQLGQQMMLLLMAALQKPATRNGHVNALEHIRGYLKRTLHSDEKQELTALIEQYRHGYVPLVAPMTLLRHYFRRYPDPYISEQLFMQPYPEQLGLRNGI